MTSAVRRQCPLRQTHLLTLQFDDPGYFAVDAAPEWFCLNRESQ
ncbi:hypothetical protein AM1_F0052 (plasmid) [Acaryochloris marina MBIC11017]|uniref:Uncharacterized protein n=1 Tax=Acaryochloris marina (strain MBIC 11017) TaxID=329726 RepID=A8ZQ35_ACAM1|nr:hypothetical protein AM1_F0052 [Acaryochloris marina MBIC11017]